MEERLTTEERARLERLASEGKPVHARRARLLLLWDQGLAPKEIGPQVGLSVGRVRYWLRAFRDRQMDVFPDDLLTAVRPAEAAPAEPVVEVQEPEITIEELCRRYDVDMAHARHVAEMALALFDLTAEVHGLSPERRDLLEKAAILHNVGFSFYPEKHHTVGRDIILDHRLAELGDELPEEERSSLDPLLASWQEQREAARAQMLEYLDGKRYQQFVRDFGEFLLTEGAGAIPIPAHQPVPHRVCHLVPSLIYDRYQVVRGYETAIEGAAIETLHALRIDCKRLRYSLEFFREVLGPEAGDMIKEVVIIQDHLGNLHDADVACSLLVGFLDGWARAEQRERINVSGVTRYLVAKQNELRELIESFPEAWRNFNRPEVRRKLALAVSVL